MGVFARPIAIGYPVTINRNFKNSYKTLQHSLNNAGDAFAKEGIFDRHRHQEEREMFQKISDLWNIDIKECWGYITSGGTEGNLEGLWFAREKYPDGILYYSEQSHYSIKKIANILRMDSMVVPSDERGSIDINALKDMIDLKKPVILLANIGSTFLGAIDDIEKIKSTLKTEDLYIHGDAAFFGFIMPYIQDDFDGYRFLDSISVSCHKWPGVPFPSGVFMSKKDLPNYVERYEEIIGQRDVTISGSRSGHAAFFMNEFFETIDLKREVEECLDMSEYIFRRLSEAVPQSKPWKNENIPIIVFESPSTEIIRKWSLASFDKRSHVCVLKHVTKEVADSFIHDMAKYFGRRSHV